MSADTVLWVSGTAWEGSSAQAVIIGADLYLVIQILAISSAYRCSIKKSRHKMGDTTSIVIWYFKADSNNHTKVTVRSKYDQARMDTKAPVTKAV